MPKNVVPVDPWSRRRFLTRAVQAGGVVAVSGGLAAFLQACSNATSSPSLASRAASAGASTGASATAPPVTGDIVLTFLGTAVQEETYTEYWSFFKDQFPGINLQPQAIPSDLGWTGYIDAVNAQIAGGRPPDVAQVATQGLLLFSALAHPINDLVARDQAQVDEMWSTLSPNWRTWLQQTSHDGREYYLPGESFNTMCVWYNSDILEEAGVPEPSPDWTWGDFYDVCTRVSQGEDRYAFNINIAGASFQSLDPWLLTNGASILNDDWTTATLDTDAAIEAVQFERRLVEEGLTPAPGGTFDPFAAATQGTLAMFGGGRWPQLALAEELDHWKLLPWPQNTTKGSPVGWRSNAILESSESKDAAWEYAKFSASVEASDYFNVRTVSSGVPAHSSLFDAFAEASPPGSNHLYEALEYASVNPSPQQANEMERLIADGLTQMLVGNTPVEQGMRDLNARIQDLL